MCSLRRWSTLLLLVVAMPSFSGTSAWPLQQDGVDSSDEVTSGEPQRSVAPGTETYSSDSQPELSTPFSRAAPTPVSISPSAEYTALRAQVATSDLVDTADTGGFVSAASPESSPPVTSSDIDTGSQPPLVTSSDIDTGFQPPPVTSSDINTGFQPPPVTSSDINPGSQPPPVTSSDINTGSQPPTVTSHVLNVTSILSTQRVTDDYGDDDTTSATDVSSEPAVSGDDRDVLKSVVFYENCPGECLCFELTVDCSNRDLIEVPEGLPAHLHILKLHGNQIERVVQGTLSHLSQLRSIDLRSNVGIVLDRKAFVNNRQLQEIDMSGCNLETLPPLDLPSGELNLKLVGNRIARLDMESLRHYSSVARLDLSNNKLKSLHNATFPVSSQLTHLILSGNQLSSIEPGCLSNLTSLQQLQLFKNRLQQLHKDTFSGLAALVELDLSKNHLTTVGSLLFSGLNSLQMLKLRGNRIQQLQPGAFYQLPNMTTLMLDHNEIGNVSKSWLYGVSRLRVLTLSHNRIGDVTLDAWRHCHRLIRLDLAHNQLTAVTSRTFSWLPRLNFLLLAHNQLAAVEPSALSGCPQLRVLELDDNQLASTVEDSSGVFAGLQLLERLSLTGNQVTSVGVGALSGLSGLRELQLGSCPLSTLSQAAVEPLVSLQQLTLRSGQLLCDCELRWLAGWLRQRGLVDADVSLSCAHPASVRGRRVTQLRSDVDMLCSASPKPRISLQPHPQSTLRGANLSLICQAETSANDTLQFRWLRDRRPLQLSGQQRVRVQNLATSFPDARPGSVMHSTLHVQGLLDTDSGVYQCVVTNRYGVSYSQPARVHVYVYPTFSVRPSDVQLPAGGTAVLECGAGGLPAPTVHWFKDGGAHFPAAVERRMNLMASRHQFSISQVRADDQGVYTCTARSPAGQITANATLTVQEAPSFVRSMTDVRVSAGDTAVLECMSAGSPRPRLDWYKDGLPLVSTDRHFFTAGRQLLIVMQCRPEDAGLYGCQITNELGDRRGSAQLTVLPDSGLSVSAGGVAGSPYVLLVVPVLLGVLLTSLLWVLVFCQLRKRQLRRQRARAAASALSAGCPLLERVPRPPSPPAALVRAGGATEILLASSAVQLYSDNGSEHSSGKDSGQGGHEEPVDGRLAVALLAGVESDDEGVVGTPLVGRRRRVLTTFQGGGARTQRGSLQTVVPRHLYADRRLSQLTADPTVHRRSNGL